MSNMSYCRFRNTASDLADCADALEDLLSGADEGGALSRDELEAAKRLVLLCSRVVDTVSQAAGLDDQLDLDDLERGTAKVLDQANAEATRSS